MMPTCSTRFSLPAVALASLLTLAACGGGGGGNDETPVTPEPPPPVTPTPSNQIESFTVPGYPHSVVVYRPASASRAIVVLHGGGGSTDGIAYQMGLKTTPDAAPTQDTVNWSALNSAGVIAVFPQGQAASAGSNARTWSNYAMTSGQDDLGFLKALSAALRTRYGLSNVALAGHSMGGAMVNRVRCEAPDSFQSYVSISGPASAHFQAAGSCAAGAQARYAGLFGSADIVIPGEWTAATWNINIVVQALNTSAFVNPAMVGEWQSFLNRAQLMCGETPSLAAKTSSGAASTWTACGGKLQEQLADGAGHGIDSIASMIGQAPFTLVAAFTAK